MKIPRRKFIKYSAIAGSSVPFINSVANITDSDTSEAELDIHIFSKHLQFLDYESTGRMAKEIGFSGVDLTVRPKGHVLPENVASDLPLAIKEIEKGGSRCTLITTSIESTSNPLDRNIIETAGASGIKFYRTHWFKYKDDVPMIESLNHYQNEIRDLSAFNKTHGIIGCYQNHAGKNIGASFWEIHKVLETADPEFFGTQYDIRHATAEGGHSWENGLRLLHDKIKVIVLKDFKWAKVDGKWKVKNVPVGEGMIDFDKYFKLLKKYKVNVPVSLHLEYPLGGADKGRSEITVAPEVVYDAMRKDLSVIREMWARA